MKVHAIGVFAAAENTETRPRAAKSWTSWPKKTPTQLPSAAPMKNRGVTSPPLKPAPSDTVVRNSLISQLYHMIDITGVPKAGPSAFQVVPMLKQELILTPGSY